MANEGGRLPLSGRFGTQLEWADSRARVLVGADGVEIQT